MCISRHAILEFLRQHPSVSGVKLKNLSAFVSGTLEMDLSPADAEALKKLMSKLKTKWSSAGRNKKTFIKQNQKWINVEFCLSERVCRSKLRATESQLQRHSRELAFAAASNIHQEGCRKADQLVDAVASPRQGPRLSAALATSKRRRQLQP